MDPACLLACSGPGASQAIAASQNYAATMVIASGGIAMFSAIVTGLRPTAFFGTLIALGMLAMHPGLWMSAIHGDCGESLREFSAMWTVAITICAAIAIGRSFRASGSTKNS